MIRRLLVLVLTVALGAGGYYLYRYYNRPQAMILTGIVTTREVNLSPLIQGRISRLLVRKGTK